MPEPIRVPCPGCHALNRVDPGRLAQATCGKCARPLAAGKPLALTQATFAAHAEKSDLPLLVDFWAPWCGPCRAMAPAFEQAAGLLAPLVVLAKVNTEEERGLGASYGIQSIPTMVLFLRGRELGRVSGAMNAGQIAAWARQQLPG